MVDLAGVRVTRGMVEREKNCAIVEVIEVSVKNYRLKEWRCVKEAVEMVG